MKTIAEKTDTDLKNDVLAELKYEPGVNISDIGVLVKEGAVTLNGFVTNYVEKWNAVRATKRVAGVRAIADDIVVKLSTSLIRTDSDIAGAAAIRLSWFPSIPKGAVKAVVRDGWLTLEGELEWDYQRSDIQDNFRYMAGVKGVTNLITIKSNLTAAGVKNSIETAFQRSALLDAKKIHVETSGGKVTLSGNVRNYAELDEAVRVAWAAPGIGSVDNLINVTGCWDFED
ncbi:MAG: BON domain-containing protein [Opitutus sp.]